MRAISVRCIQRLSIESIVPSGDFVSLIIDSIDAMAADLDSRPATLLLLQDLVDRIKSRKCER